MQLDAGGTSRSVHLIDHVTLVTESVMGPVTAAPSVMILVHSALLDQQLWTEFVGRLRQCLTTPWRIVRYDLRGHGSASASTPTTSIDQLAADLFALADSVAPGRPLHLVGLSLGGAVVQAAALAKPDRVASVTVMASAARFDQDAMRRRAELGSGGIAEQLEGTMLRWLGPDAANQSWRAESYVRSTLLRNSGENWKAAWNALGRFNVADALNGLGPKLLAIAGEADPAAPPAVLASIAESVPKGRVVVIPGGVHLLPLTQPGAVALEVCKFVEENDEKIP